MIAWFEVRGQVRGGKNHVGITREGHRYPNKTFENWRDNAVAQIIQDPDWNFKDKPIDWPVAIELEYTPGDRRDRDIPAIVDAIYHVLEKAGVVKNDTLFKDLVFTTEDVDRDRCGIVIQIKDRKKPGAAAA